MPASRPYSYRTLLILSFVLLVIASSGAMISVSYLLDRKSFHQRIEFDAMTSVRRVETHLSTLVSLATRFGRSQATTEIPEHFSGEDLTPLFQGILRRFVNYEEFSNVGFGIESTGEYGMIVRDPDGRLTYKEYRKTSQAGRYSARVYNVDPISFQIAARPSEEGIELYDVRQRPHYQLAKRYGKVSWTESYLFWPQNERGLYPGISLGLPVKDSAGKLRGVWDVDFDVFLLSQFLKRWKDDLPYGYAFVVETRRDGERRIVAHPDQQVLRGIGNSFVERFNDVRDPVAVEALKNGATATGKISEFTSEGERYFTIEIPLSGSTTSGDTPTWSVVGILPRGPAIAPLIDQQVRQLLLMFGIVGVGILGAILLARKLSRPFEAARMQIRQLAAGQIPVEVAPHGSSEQRALTSELNEMSKLVTKRERQLRGSEAKFRGVFENSADLIALYRINETEIVLEDINSSFLRLFQLSKESLLGKPFSGELPAPFSTQMEHHLNDCRQLNVAIRFDTGVDLPIGHRWFNTVITPVYDADGESTRIATISRDISSRKKAEDSLREARQRLEMHRNQTPLAVIEWDLEFRVIAWNPAAEKIFGFRAGSAIGRHFSFIVPTDLHPFVQQICEDIVHFRGGLNSTNQNLRSDGSVILCEWFNTPLIDEYGHAIGFASTVHDVTRIREADDQLRKSERRFRSVFEESPAMLCLAKRDGLIHLDVNDRWLETLQLTKVEVLGKTPADIGIDIPHELKVVTSERISVDGGFRDLEMPIFVRGRTVMTLTSAKSLEIDGIECVLWSSIDITDRFRAEQTLRASELRFRQAFVASPAMMSITRGHDRAILDVNNTWESVIGTHRQDALGKRIEELGWKFEIDNADTVLTRLARDRSVRQFMISATSPSGNPFYAITSASLIEIDGESCILSSSVDITPRIEAEQAVRRINAELETRVAERTARLEALNTELESFAYTVSHDLRAPLRSIDGYSRAVVEDYQDRIDDDGRQFLERICFNVKRMSELIDDLLSMSRATRLEMHLVTVPLSALAERTIGELRMHHPNRDVEVIIAPGMRAEGDPTLLKIVLENLFGNAWKYSGRTSRSRIEFGGEMSSGWSTFFIRDNGAGFDERYAAQLFKPFSRLHRADEFEGHGIGLATVARIISRHGGRIWAEGKVDAGATFWFTLPAPRPPKPELR